MFKQICHIAFEWYTKSENSEFVVLCAGKPQLIYFQMIKKNQIKFLNLVSLPHIEKYMYLVLIGNPIVKYTRLSYFISEIQGFCKDDVHI